MCVLNVCVFMCENRTTFGISQPHIKMQRVRERRKEKTTRTMRQTLLCLAILSFEENRPKKEYSVRATAAMFGISRVN